MAKDVTLKLRVSADEKAAWEAAASAAGLPLSAWLRRAAGAVQRLDCPSVKVAQHTFEQRAASVPVAVCRFAASGGCRKLGKAPCAACA